MTERRDLDRPRLAHPHHRLIAGLAHRFAWDPHFQFRLHLIATGIWVINAIIASAVFVFARGFWNRASVLYLVLISLYANFATDYDAVSASLAGIHAEAARREVEGRPPPGSKNSESAG